MNNDMKKIFIAEDDEDILGILRIMLGNHGYEIIQSNDPGDIFRNEKNELPDLILLDIWMSGIDGRDICGQLKKNERTKTIPVIFISANSNIEEISKEYGADGFISKP